MVFPVQHKLIGYTTRNSHKHIRQAATRCMCVKLWSATKIERRIFFSFFVCVCVSLFWGDGKGEQRRQKHDRNRENFVYAFQGNMDLLFPFIVILNDIPKCTAAIPSCIRVFGANDTDAVCVCVNARVRLFGANESNIPSHCCSFIQVSLAQSMRFRQTKIGFLALNWNGCARRDTTYLQTTELYNAQQEHRRRRRQQQLNDRRRHTTVILLHHVFVRSLLFVVLLVRERVSYFLKGFK